jgi:hypothetical protein
MARAAEAHQFAMPLQMPNQALHLTKAPLQASTCPTAHSWASEGARHLFAGREISLPRSGYLSIGDNVGTPGARERLDLLALR